MKTTTNFNSIEMYIYSIEGEYVPMPGDEVKFRLCIVPPKNEKHQAVHCEIINFCPKKHKRWEEPCTEEGHIVHWSRDDR